MQISPENLGIATGIATLFAFMLLTFALRGTSRKRVRARAQSLLRVRETHTRSKQLIRWNHLSDKARLLIFAIVGGGFGVVVDGIALGALIACLVSLLMQRYESRKQSALLKQYNVGMLRVLDVFLLSVRSGAGLLSGLKEAAIAYDGPVELDLRNVVERVENGMTLNDGLAIWQQRRPLQAVKLMCACLVFVQETGGSMAQAAESARSTIRNAIAIDQLMRTNAAQATSSAMFMALLPAGLSGPVLLANSSAREFMFHNPFGITVLTVGLTLNYVGFLWMSRMVAGATK